ncbi:uncharacterized protein [Narcine bancroftii]|uniref:uncharacterized protein n=1 Tax=Narcine bancroftii TaxID=1343680 RepID=UPI00383115E5
MKVLAALSSRSASSVKSAIFGISILLTFMPTESTLNPIENWSPTTETPASRLKSTAFLIAFVCIGTLGIIIVILLLCIFLHKTCRSTGLCDPSASITIMTASSQCCTQGEGIHDVTGSNSKAEGTDVMYTTINMDAMTKSGPRPESATNERLYAQVKPSQSMQAVEDLQVEGTDVMSTNINMDAATKSGPRPESPTNESLYAQVKPSQSMQAVENCQVEGTDVMYTTINLDAVTKSRLRPESSTNDTLYAQVKPSHSMQAVEDLPISREV